MSRGPWSAETKVRHGGGEVVVMWSEERRIRNQRNRAAAEEAADSTPALAREDALQRAWRRLVREVTASHDLEALNALKAFQIHLEAFLEVAR